MTTRTDEDCEHCRWERQTHQDRIQ